MAKFIKSFSGVERGAIYPTIFAIGDECPAELEAAALSVGALADAAPRETRAAKKAPEQK